MTSRIVISHVKGAKINQIEQFQLDTNDEITLGRDPSSTVVFDSQRDDVVGRRHAIIKITRGDALAFRLIDLGSVNGTTIVGGKKAAPNEPIELLPGDIVELGAGGPQFMFDLQPRPANFVSRTRDMRALRDTREVVAAEIASDALDGAAHLDSRNFDETPDPDAPIRKAGVGKATVESMLAAQRETHKRVWLYSIAGVLGLMACVGGGILFLGGRTAQEVSKGAAEQIASAQAAQAKLDAQKMDPQKISARFRPATVLISRSWTLYDQGTGRPLFHKMIKPNANTPAVPAYAKFPNGALVRMLTIDDENGANPRIAEEGSGTGFVVNNQGVLLTNKHVAAGWMSEYGWKSYERRGSTPIGIVFKLDAALRQTGVSALADESFEALARLRDWTPGADSAVIFSPTGVPLRKGVRGQNDEMQVGIPNSTLKYAARLINFSNEADVAAVQVDGMPPVVPVELAQDDVVQVGQAITVLGYPAISQSSTSRKVTTEAGRMREIVEDVPDITAVPGHITNIGRGARQQDGAITQGTLGDAYQLDATATGAGNSGGPVFDEAGRVIAIFTYQVTRGSERVTFAIPISHGRNLLNPRRVN